MTPHAHAGASGAHEHLDHDARRDDHGEDREDHEHDDGHARDHREEHGHHDGSPRDHDAGHPRDDHGDHGHGHGGLLGRLRGLVAPHSHDAGDAVDNELETSQRGIRALIISFAGLGVTAGIQAVVVVLSGSVGLLGDTLHNFADALTAIPLAIAFTIGRRPATRRFTHGYGRSEDIAGLAILLLILASSVLAAAFSIGRLLHPQGIDHLPFVGGASVAGFAGNELVARYRIRVGREIGSAALVADGLHARTDALTSLAVLVGAGGVALGFQLADPIVGLVITLAILVVLRQAAREVFARLMDAVDPALVGQVDAVLRATPGVLGVGDIRLRWIGHALRAECEIVVDRRLSIVEAHDVAEEAQHKLLHEVRRVTAVLVHADPEPAEGDEDHGLSGHHRAALTRG